MSESDWFALNRASWLTAGDRARAGGRRRRALLLGAALASTACHSGARVASTRAPRTDVPPARTAPNVAYDAAIDALADGAAPDAELADTHTEITRPCRVRGLRAQDVHALDPAVFPREQREATARGAWRLPPRLAWALPLPRGERDRVRDRLLVLLSPSDDASCDVLAVCDGRGHAPVHGPFAGMVGSDARWTAHALCGRRLVVGFFDASGAPRVLRDAGEEFIGEDAWTGRGVWLEPLEAFSDGRSVLLGTYATGDGESDYTLRIWSGIEGELRELGREAMTHTMGAPYQFSITRRGDAGPAPSILVSRRTGRSEWDDAAGDDREVFSAARTRVRHYDLHLQRFQ